jgi:N-acetylmuramoyl-L-alanine amidase
VGKKLKTGTVILFSLLLSSFSAKIGPAPVIRTVVIDAGHGGKDPGCHGDRYREKDVSLAVALKLGAYIQKYCKDVKVVYTRSTDVFVELNERAAIANRNKADLFICIHCNSASHKDKKSKRIVNNPSAMGAETYVMGLHKTQGNLELAKRENSAILLEKDYKEKYNGFDPNSDEAYILMSIRQNAYLAQSLGFAAKVQHNFKTHAGRVDKGVKQAGFLVLWKTTMPSVLIEIGFLTNPDDHNFLGSATGQDYMAASIFRGFRQYKDEAEGRAEKYDDEIEKMSAYNSAGGKVEKETTTSDSKKKEEEDELGPDDEADTADSEGAIEKTDVPKVKIDTLAVEPRKATGNKTAVTFKVQFYSSEKQLPLTSSKFKELDKVSMYKAGAIYKYTSGEFNSPEEAIKLQKKIRVTGFPDAFVASFKDGKRIDYNDALKLIKP